MGRLAPDPTGMPDRHIRAMLRAATANGILDGWQGPHTDRRSYCINPRNGDAHEQPLEYVIEYVRSLEAAGIEPLHVSHELA